MNTKEVKVAAAQFAPHFLNLSKTVEKTCNLISEAGKNGAKLIVFPEAFLSGYPDWVWLIPNGNSTMLDDLYQELVENAVTIPDSTTQKLCQAAKDAGVYVAVGIHERNAEASGFTLFNTLLYINDQGSIIGKHRKLIPTGGERLVWGQGNGDTLAAFDTHFGKLGGLLCWENYMPLARQAMYAVGTEVYVAPTWDSSENWLLSMRHIAREGGMFVINVCQAVRKDDIPDRYAFKQLYSGNSEWINSGNSCIINPRGEIIAGPSSNRQEILYADLDLSLITKSKRMFDVTGHYARPDVFRYEIKKS
uniref:Nitrilase n=1 Tax=uncultured organism TaxID=155900 RepID=Q6RWN5_9ZZZZ|nr:nitrilase [uncultured organism]